MMLEQDLVCTSDERAERPSDVRETTAASLEQRDVRAQRRRALRRQGMTLIEIMIVVVIMALVATGVGMAVLPALNKAKVNNAKSAVQTVRSAVTLYIATNNTSECPTMQQLIDDKAIDKSTATRDPWDREFLIECDGTDVSVKSAGPDGEFGNADDIPKPGEDSK